ncbi:hypothetical protein QTP88_027076 [Uroleucon formosanum]
MEESRNTTIQERADVFVQKSLKNVFPMLFKLFRLFFTIPMNSASCERSFSCLRRLKTYTRNKIGQERLSSLALLAIERNDRHSAEKKVKNFEQILEGLSKVESSINNVKEVAIKTYNDIQRLIPTTTYRPRNPDVLRLLSTDDYENDQTPKSSPRKMKNASPLPPDTILGKNASTALASLPEKNAFGINYNKLTNQHLIGKEIIKFNLDNIILKGKEREITPGMWCLLTQSDVPNLKDYTTEDLDKYKQILIETDSIYKNNDRSTGKAKSSGGDKYMRLISPIWKAIKGDKTPTTPTEILNPTVPDFPTIPIKPKPELKDKCFLWAILSALHPVEKNAQRIFIRFTSNVREQIKGVIEYYKQFKIVEDDDAKKLKLYEDKLKKELENKNTNMKKVRDHDHLTGEYRGAAYSICNLNYQNPRFIPIVFHNFSGYDAHLFIKKFGNDNKRIKLIPNNEEKYISFSKMMPRVVTRKDKEKVIYTGLRFIDSFKFLPSSLDKLINNLRNDSKLNLKNKFKELSKYFPEEHLDLVTRKLAYPYEYMDCEEKFNETYIIENFRDISLKKYKLDPMWYYTTPGFAWDCMLRMTNIKLDLLTDIDQILMFESGIRGGLSQCSQRHSKANNKYMGDKFKKQEESIFLQYLDANNLYGWAMSKYLPTGDFKWVDNLNDFDVMNISDKSCKGYILEVVLSYPKELHDIHSDFPLAPERHFDNKQLPKLLTTLFKDRENSVLEFSQSPWLKSYIDFNTNLRSEAKNEFEKEYFKLMNNSVYGRTMMNVRNHVDIRLCSNTSKVEKLIGKPNFDRRTIFTENLAAVHMKRTQISFTQPIYIGMCVLDLSKMLITKKHDIFTVEQNKKALSVYDDKRFILNNGIDTLAWGHYKTNIDKNDFVNHLNTLIRNQNQKD